MPEYNPWGTPIFPGASAFGVGSPAEDAQRQPTIVDNILSHIAGALGRGFMAPGQALNSPVPLTSEQLVAPAQDIMRTMIGGAPMAERGAAGVFGGRLAPLAIKDAAEAEAVAPDMVRLYRGGGNNPGGPKWVTTDRRYAERYTTPGLAHSDNAGSFLHYVDVPATDPRVAMPAGQSVHSFEAAPDIADRLRPFYRAANVGVMGGKLGNPFDVVAEKYPQLKIDGSPARSPNDYGTLSRIAVPEELRGQGLATKAMADIVTEADRAGMNLALTPSADWGASVPRLKEFYSRFGFVPNAGRSKDFATRETMIRPAKKSD